MFPLTSNDSTGEVVPMPPDLAPLPAPMIVAASRLLLRDFAAGISTGRSPSPNVDDGWQTQAVLDAVRASACTARTVAIRQQ